MLHLILIGLLAAQQLCQYDVCETLHQERVIHTYSLGFPISHLLTISAGIAVFMAVVRENLH